MTFDMWPMTHLSFFPLSIFGVFGRYDFVHTRQSVKFPIIPNNGYENVPNYISRWSNLRYSCYNLLQPKNQHALWPQVFINLFVWHILNKKPLIGTSFATCGVGGVGSEDPSADPKIANYNVQSPGYKPIFWDIFVKYIAKLQIKPK